MDAGGSPLEVRFQPRPSIRFVAGSLPWRVLLGPSMTHWRHELQRLLGPGWVVDELISSQAPAGAADVVVLGTPELPAGEIEPGRPAGRTSLLIGTGPRSPAGAVASPPAGAVERLVAALRAVAVGSAPGGAPVTARAAS